MSWYFFSDTGGCNSSPELCAAVHAKLSGYSISGLLTEIPEIHVRVAFVIPSAEVGGEIRRPFPPFAGKWAQWDGLKGSPFFALAYGISPPVSELREVISRSRS